MVIVKFNSSEEAEHEFHIENDIILTEFITYKGERRQSRHIPSKPRKHFKDKKGEYIKLHAGQLFGNKVKKHYL